MPRLSTARTAFEDSPEQSAAAGAPGGVRRWLKGCYIDGDAVWDKYRVTAAKAEAEIVARNAPPVLPVEISEGAVIGGCCGGGCSSGITSPAVTSESIEQL